MAESEKLLMEKVNRWKLDMEEKRLRVNIGKTKVMRCQPGAVRREQSGKFPCGICKKGVGATQFFVMVAVSGYTRNAVKYEANSKRINATNVPGV